MANNPIPDHMISMAELINSPFILYQDDDTQKVYFSPDYGQTVFSRPYNEDEKKLSETVSLELDANPGQIPFCVTERAKSTGADFVYFDDGTQQ